MIRFVFFFAFFVLVVGSCGALTCSLGHSASSPYNNDHENNQKKTNRTWRGERISPVHDSIRRYWFDSCSQCAVSSSPLPLRFLAHHFHRYRHQPLELLIRMRREQRLGPHVILGIGVSVEKAAHERDERDAL